MDRVLDPFQVHSSSIDVADARKPACEMARALADDHLAAVRDRAQTCRHVEGRTAERAVLERDRLARVDSDPDPQWKVGIGLRLLDKLLLDVNSGPDGLPGGLEHDKRFVTANFNHPPAAELRALTNQVAELRGQPCGRLVAELLGEARITADVRDQERADGCVWCGSQTSTECTPRRSFTQTAQGPS
jgi:hypothetical protein